MAEIVVDHVTMRYGSLAAVDDVRINFADGEVACLLGPSGCGKTTLMRVIAGLEHPTTGRILFDGRDVTSVPTRRRDIGMVFQYPVVYPILSVAENISVPLKHDRSLSAKDRERRIAEVLELLDMRELGDAFVEDLDPGSRQKVSIGRAVVRRSDVILFDEPTTNVEANAKLQLIRAVKRVAQRTHQTMVYVTHDQTEAMTLADRIALMRDGKITQYGYPDALYNNPTTEFGGWFLGNPGMNFVPAEIAGSMITAPILAEPLAVPAALALNAKLTIGIRPEHISMSAKPGDRTVAGRLCEQTVGIAGRYLARVALGDVMVKLKTDGKPPAPIGSTVHLSVAREHLVLFADGQRVVG